MDWPSLTIGFPTWHRAQYFDRTMKTILRRPYPGPLDIVVVQSGPDPEMERIAAAYNAKYIETCRDPEPEFQNIAMMWNMCMTAATGEVVILQCAEVEYESDEAITSLVECVMSGNKILATSLVRDLDEQRVMVNWQNHPTKGSRPGWISGSGPHAFRREEMLEHGGYDTRFYGYGSEDDWFFYTLRKNGWDIRYVEQSVCAHQWHPRVAYEPITGYANRSLIRLFYTEAEAGERLPLPNRQAISYIPRETEERISWLAHLAEQRCLMSDTFRSWLWNWVAGDRHPDDIFVAQRTIANEGLGVPSEVGEMVTEAAWAVIRAKEAREQAEKALAEGRIDWLKRCEHSAEIHDTWGARAFERAIHLMNTK